MDKIGMSAPPTQTRRNSSFTSSLSSIPSGSSASPSSVPSSPGKIARSSILSKEGIVAANTSFLGGSGGGGGSPGRRHSASQAPPPMRHSASKSPGPAEFGPTELARIQQHLALRRSSAVGGSSAPLSSPGGGKAYPPQLSGDAPASSSAGSASAHSETAVVQQFPSIPSSDRRFAATVLRDVICSSAGVPFSSVSGCASAKKSLQEAVVLPQLLPHLFVGLRSPWTGVLLFGPPGTGKTLLARAVAGLTTSTFFNCSTSTLVSKFRGDSEKLLRVTFELAKLKRPSVIFLDEVDALVGGRGQVGEHEASRRFKTELYICFDGLNRESGSSGGSGSGSGSEGEGDGEGSKGGAGDGGGGGHKAGVMVLAATNNPWDLDEAMRRRLEKRIYVPLPDDSARVDMFKKAVADLGGDEEARSDEAVAEYAQLTKGYSGADIQIVCREANMSKIRGLLGGRSAEDLIRLKEEGSLDEELKSRSVSKGGVVEAIKKTKRSVKDTDISAYVEWDANFGSR